jgi:D-threo-aldose 1-dehydrogenase
MGAVALVLGEYGLEEDTMKPLDKAEIGSSRVMVTRLGLGGAPFGSMPLDAAEQSSIESVRKGLELGIGFYDTAPFYGAGRSERYYAAGLSGVERASYALSTKVGRVLNPVDAAPGQDIYRDLPQMEVAFDFSRDGVLRSFEESLKRLELDRIDILLIHDPDDYHEQAVGEAFPALAELRSQGVIGAIGAGMNFCEPLAQFGREADFDCFLLAGRYTLLDHSGLDDLLPLCEERGMSIILGGPYNSGVLASDLGEGTTYFYRSTPPEVLGQARKIKAVCDRHDVPLKAAALQFGLAHPAVAATIPGAVSAAEVQENFDLVSYAIPDDLWVELKHEGLLPENAPTP